MKLVSNFFLIKEFVEIFLKESITALTLREVNSHHNYNTSTFF